MVHFLITALVLPLWTGIAVSVVAPDSDHKPLMRSHLEAGAEHSVVHLQAAGEVVNMKKHRHKSSTVTKMDTCDKAYVLGEDSSNGRSNCTDPTKQALIYEEALCREAAIEASASPGRADAQFVVDIDHMDKCPIGCFKDKSTNTFFFNPNGDWPINPASIGGTPVCTRRRYMNGTTPTGGCPTGYANTLDHDQCRTAAECQGYCIEDEYFQVGFGTHTADDETPPWTNNYNDMVSGCHIREADGCVYYNVPRAVAPTSPQGIPVCKITATYGPT